MVKNVGCKNKNIYHYIVKENENGVEKKNYFLNIKQIMDVLKVSKREIYQHLNPDNECYDLLKIKNKNIKSIEKIRIPKIRYEFICLEKNEILH